MPNTPDSLLKKQGPRGFTVEPYVREERNGRVYFRWPRKGASGGWVKMASDLDWPEGPRRRERVAAEANARALRLSDARRQGQADHVLERLALGDLPGEQANIRAPKRITIRDVMQAAIGPSPRGLKTRGEGAWLARKQFWDTHPPAPRGRFSSWTQQARQARREADRIEDALGPDTDFLTLNANDLSALWKANVPDNAAKRVDVALQVSRWAAEEFAHRGYKALVVPKRGWKRAITKATKPAVQQGVAKSKRFTWAEAGHLWRCIFDRSNDLHPTLRLALIIGGEARLGQVLRSTVHHVQQLAGMFYVQPPGSEKKLTVLTKVPLSVHEDFEAAFFAARQRSGDGRLFPQSRHPAGDEFARLEGMAGVPHRAPYGLRRAMIDVAPFAMAELLQDQDNPLEVGDPVVLHIVSHHRTDTVKDGVYRETPVGLEFELLPDSPMLSLIAAAARVRDHARRLCLMKAGYAEPPDAWLRLTTSAGDSEADPYAD